jgi:hypothetical protein
MEVYAKLSKEQLASKIIYIQSKLAKDRDASDNEFLAWINTLPKVDMDKVTKLVEERW